MCKTATRPWTAIVKLPPETINSFRKELRTQGITVTPSSWGPHITWVRNEPLGYYDEWEKHQGEKIEVEIDTTLKSGSNYWWVSVVAPELEEFRYELGLNRRPSYNLHMTIGKEVKRR